MRLKTYIDPRNSTPWVCYIEDGRMDTIWGYGDSREEAVLYAIAELQELHNDIGQILADNANASTKETTC